MPQNFTYPKGCRLLNLRKPRVKALGESSFLIKIGSLNLLTDPTMKNIESLPRIDAVLVSHDDRKALKAGSVRKLSRKFPEMRWLVPIGLGKWMRVKGARRVTELSWWQDGTFEIAGQEVTFTSVPAQHHSGRFPFMRNRSLWCGWVVTASQRTLYFAGDTGYNTHDFQAIGERFGEIDVALLPIDGKSSLRANSAEAVQMHLDVRAKMSIPVRKNPALKQPLYDLHLALEQNQLTPVAFRILEPGDETNW